MSPVALELPKREHNIFDHGGRLFADPPASERTDAHGGMTLDDLITGAWEGLAVRQAVGCPVCNGAMMAVNGSSAARGLSGGCLSCGTTLG